MDIRLARCTTHNFHWARSGGYSSSEGCWLVKGHPLVIRHRPLDSSGMKVSSREWIITPVQHELPEHGTCPQFALRDVRRWLDNSGLSDSVYPLRKMAVDALTMSLSATTHLWSTPPKTVDTVHINHAPFSIARTGNVWKVCLLMDSYDRMTDADYDIAVEWLTRHEFLYDRLWAQKDDAYMAFRRSLIADPPSWAHGGGL